MRTLLSVSVAACVYEAAAHLGSPLNDWTCTGLVLAVLICAWADIVKDKDEL